MALVLFFSMKIFTSTQSIDKDCEFHGGTEIQYDFSFIHNPIQLLSSLRMSDYYLTTAYIIKLQLIYG